MTAMLKTEIDFTMEELEGLAETAKRRGHKSITEYIRYLVNEDADLHKEASPVDDDDNHILQSFAGAWEDSKANRVLTSAEFWEAMQSDDED